MRYKKAEETEGRVRRERKRSEREGHVGEGRGTEREKGWQKGLYYKNNTRVSDFNIFVFALKT